MREQLMSPLLDHSELSLSSRGRLGSSHNKYRSYAKVKGIRGDLWFESEHVSFRVTSFRACDQCICSF